MPEATQVRSSAPAQTRINIQYWVEMSQPETHLFEVTLQVSGWQSETLDLKMPVWTPGSYLVREYARHLQDFTVMGRVAASWQKLSKNHWQIKTAGLTDITVRYRVFANELTVRTNHLDSTHGYFNPAALCFYIPGYEANPIRITIVLSNSQWHVSTPLPAIVGEKHTFEAENFDTLVDSPFEMGTHAVHEFEVMGKPHQFAIWGQGNLDVKRLLEDTAKIIKTEADLFEGLPYESYLFLLHLSSQGYGGLEHKTSCTLNYSRMGFRSEEKYNRFMQLVAHEFFHLWNIKRIRPKALECFDYDQENYTPSLWFSEGTTSYYDVVLPFRAGIYDAKTFLKELGKEVCRFLTTPGRRVQPLAESSFDAWIKLYRRDTNSDNSQMSYYLKGAMVSFLLDLLIRKQHHNKRSLDDVMRQMWQQFGRDEVGFTPEQLESVIEAIAAVDLKSFFEHALNSVDELPFDQYLEPFGLRLCSDQEKQNTPFTGLKVKSEQGRELVKFVEMGSPAQKAGLDAGDELLALNGLRVTAEHWGDRLCDFAPGDTVEVSFFHQEELLTRPMILAEPHPTKYWLAPVDRPSTHQTELLRGWLGITPSDLGSHS